VEAIVEGLKVVVEQHGDVIAQLLKASIDGVRVFAGFGIGHEREPVREGADRADGLLSVMDGDKDPLLEWQRYFD
jgi:hypothetical protein